jgi:uncharacterized protein
MFRSLRFVPARLRLQQRPSRRAPGAAVAAMAPQPDVAAIAREAKRVAVIGIRPATDTRGRDLSDRPAAFVPAALAADGVAIVPVPLPAAEADTYFGAAPVSLADLARLPPVDVAVFFRRPADLPPAAEVVAARPAVAWLQSGITRPDWEAEVAAAGITVVSDRCIKVERARAKL